MKNNLRKKDGLYIELSDEDRKIINELKEKHSINITQLIKNFLKDKVNKLNKEIE